MPDSPFYELAQFRIDPAAVRLLPRPYCMRHYAVVLGPLPSDPMAEVTVGMLAPDDDDLVRKIALELKRPVRAVRLNAYEIETAIDVGFGTTRSTSGRARVTLPPIVNISFAAETPATQIVDELLATAVELGASDVHIETYEDDVDVRLRIDGMLRQVSTPISVSNVPQIVSRIKVLTRLDITERRVAQDGRINTICKVSGMDRKVDFRVSVVPGPYGEDVVLRVLDNTKPLIGLDALGMADDVRDRFTDLIANPEGLLLVTGPTGSGKTTTLYAAVQAAHGSHRKILTVEDPIEYYFPKINQKQVQSPGMGFADYARAFMRQNPDVILIGEIRDEDTTAAAIKAAQTGHLVLGTLHTVDSTSAPARLEVLGADPHYIATSLLGIVSQRLLRALCPACRVERAATAEEVRRLHLPESGRTFFASAGCDACRQSGYVGRVGIYELLVVSRALTARIADRVAAHELRREAIREGMRTISQDALDKAARGLTSLAEIIRVIPYRVVEGDHAP